FSTCLCGLDNKACTIKDGNIDMDKLDENEWTRNYFGDEYHLIVLTNLAIIGRLRLQQFSIPTNMAIDNGNDKKESNGPKLNVCHASTCTDDRKPLEHEKAFRLCERKDFLLKDDLQPKPGSSEALKQKVLMNK
ncbi:hypothetical protein Bpfe_017213, partial [Biomphalaria pfeifferi]